MNYENKLLKSLKNKIILGNSLDYENNETELHIGYGVDNNYVRCMLTSIISVCINHKKMKLKFHILSAGLSMQHVEFIKKVAIDYQINIYLYEIDIEVFHGFPTQGHLPAATYFRFILPLILDVPRVLYLDADIICLKNAADLFNIDLKDNVIAAVPDTLSLGKKRNAVLNLKNHIYFNAGVLLIGIEKWNEAGVVNKVMAALLVESEKFRYLDQDALNLVLSGKVQYLEQKWNHLNHIEEGLQESVFFHFAAHPKPWNIAWPLSRLYTDFTCDLYFQYEQLSPWEDMSLEMPNNYKEMKVYAKCLWGKGKYLDGFVWFIKYVMDKMKK